MVGNLSGLAGMSSFRFLQEVVKQETWLGGGVGGWVCWLVWGGSHVQHGGAERSVGCGLFAPRFVSP